MNMNKVIRHDRYVLNVPEKKGNAYFCKKSLSAHLQNKDNIPNRKQKDLDLGLGLGLG